jgi:hypothetical protein
MIRTAKVGWLVVIAGFWVAGCASVPAETDGDDPPPSQPSAPSEALAPPTTEEPAEEPLVNTLKWTTASEVDNFGFDIYRSLTEDGPYDRITPEPLPGAGTTDEPQSYVFVDEAIDPTLDYYYYIESISLGGVREIFSPKIRAPAKQPKEE